MRKTTQKIPAAMAFLRSHMAPGQAYNAADLLAVAQRAGHTTRTLQYASERLHIRKKRAFGDKPGVARWLWTLPDDSDEPARALAVLASD